MNWFKANPIPAAIAVAVIAATAALAYLATGAAQATAEATAALDNEARQLEALKKQKPYPSKANRDKIMADAEAYETALAKLKTDLADLDEPSSSTTPQGFQDALRKAVDAISSEAIKKTIALPEAFYLGFDEFRTRLPSKEEAITLDREFNVIKTLVSQLVDLPVERIDTLTRLPQPPLAQGATSPISKTRFTISFTSGQKELIQAFNLVSRSDRFLVIRSVTFENSNSAPPPKVAAEGTPASPASPMRPRRAMRQAAAREASPAGLPFAGSTQPDEEDSYLDVVFGDEAVTATLLIEIPTFPEPATEQSPPPPKP